jgi:hypothetical protein
MDGDLLVVYVAFKEGADLDAEKAKVLAFIEGAGAEVLDRLTVDRTGMDMEEQGLSPEDARSNILQDAEEAFAAMKGRMVTELSHMGETLYVAGGVSWGDSPTPEFDNLEVLSMVLEEMNEPTGEGVIGVLGGREIGDGADSSEPWLQFKDSDIVGAFEHVFEQGLAEGRLPEGTTEELYIKDNLESFRNGLQLDGITGQVNEWLVDQVVDYMEGRW